MLVFYLAAIDNDESKNKFEYIYHKYYRFMLRTASSIIRDSSLAEDAVHETFVQLLKEIDSLRIDNEKSLQSYLYRQQKARHPKGGQAVTIGFAFFIKMCRSPYRVRGGQFRVKPSGLLPLSKRKSHPAKNYRTNRSLRCRRGHQSIRFQSHCSTHFGRCPFDFILLIGQTSDSRAICFFVEPVHPTDETPAIWNRTFRIKRPFIVRRARVSQKGGNFIRFHFRKKRTIADSFFVCHLYLRF